jgi:hypothetical protein
MYLDLKIAGLLDELENLGIDIPFSLKRRDPLEPGRRQKEEAEDRIARLFNRYFAEQRRTIRDILNRFAFDRKAIPEVQYFLDLLPPNFYGDETLRAKLAKQFTQAAHHSIQLFASSVGLDFDYTLVNVAAAKWAAKYSFELIKDIDNTTAKALQSIFSDFVKTPGMTIGDVMELLPYDEVRSLRIAITEITRVYSEADKLAGETLAKEFPGVRIIKTWFTNNDDIVCPICGPLHLQEVEQDQKFVVVVNGRVYEFDGPLGHVGCRCWRTTTTRLE